MVLMLAGGTNKVRLFVAGFPLVPPGIYVVVLSGVHSHRSNVIRHYFHNEQALLLGAGSGTGGLYRVLFQVFSLPVVVVTVLLTVHSPLVRRRGTTVSAA